MINKYILTSFESKNYFIFAQTALYLEEDENNLCFFRRYYVVYWPPTRPNMPFQRRRKLHIPLASYGKRLRRRAWLTIWDRVKIPQCSHKLIHRKRMTCELHDSYFSSMMIKHAILKTAEVAYSVGKLWEEIKWA